MVKFLQTLKSVDFYRKLKRDLQSELTEASFPGALLSVIATGVMIYLIFAELNSFLTIKEESTLILDHIKSMSEDSLQINFNVTFPRLKCEYATVDVTNFMGTHDAEMAARVLKVHLNKDGKTTTEHPLERPKALEHSMDEVHDGSTTAMLLTELTFEAEHHSHPIMIVNFFAPWCHWCQRLAPVWEKTAKQLAESHPGDRRLLLAKVDCTAPESLTLCTKYGIDAFPTILVFRKDDQGNSAHESYYGQRSVDALTQWAEHILAQEKLEIPRTRDIDADRDGVLDSHDGVGCVVSALLTVQRAPGMLRVQATSEGHSFSWETMDVSHTVNHISFGPFLSDRAWSLLPHREASSVGALDGRSFTSEKHVPTTHEHFLKVVKHEVVPAEGEPVELFAYLPHTSQIQKSGEVPTVRINYEVLPMVVHMAYRRPALYHFVTQLCAIVGGVFTVAGITAGLMSKTAHILTHKAALGKLG